MYPFSPEMIETVSVAVIAVCNVLSFGLSLWDQMIRKVQ